MQNGEDFKITHGYYPYPNPNHPNFNHLDSNHLSAAAQTRMTAEQNLTTFSVRNSSATDENSRTTMNNTANIAISSEARHLHLSEVSSESQQIDSLAIALNAVTEWEHAVPGEDRSVAAELIRTLYRTGGTTLDLSNFTSLTTLPPLPDTLRILNLEGCTSLVSLPQALPNSLTQLYLERCLLLRTLPNLPNRLEVLNCPFCVLLTALPDLPSSLKVLKLNGCASLRVLPNLPNGLKVLNCPFCVLLTALPDLPSSLKVLKLRGCTSLRALPNLPNWLEVLNCSLCISLTTMPVLPRWLLRLDLSGSALPQHLLLSLNRIVSERIHERWAQCAGATEQQIAQLNQVWQTLTNDAHYTVFNSLLVRLGENELTERVDPQHVAEVISAVARFPGIRAQIFEAARGADQDCHDRPLLIFNNIQALARGGMILHAGGEFEEGRMLWLAASMVRQSLLDEVVPQVMRQQWQQGRLEGNDAIDEAGNIANQGMGTGPNTDEALEVQLALRQQLASSLWLPFAVEGLYTNVAGLNDDDLALAYSYVLHIMHNHERMMEGLLAQSLWNSYLTSRFSEQIAAINHAFGEELNALENANESATHQREWDYLANVAQISQRRSRALQDFLTEKTQEIIKKVQTENANREKMKSAS